MFIYSLNRIHVTYYASKLNILRKHMRISKTLASFVATGRLGAFAGSGTTVGPSSDEQGFGHLAREHTCVRYDDRNR